MTRHWIVRISGKAFHGPFGNLNHLIIAEYSPQCPQNVVDVGCLFRIPETEEQYLEEVEQDEFRCLNLNVSLPAEHAAMAHLPVLVWIHGKSRS